MTENVDTRWIRSQMARLGITQKEFGAKVGIRTESQTSRAVRGTRKFLPHELHKLAELFGVSLAEAYGRCGGVAEGGSSRGVRAPEPGEIYVTQWADDDGTVHDEPPKAGPRMAPLPIGIGAAPGVIRVRAPGAPMDRWVLYHRGRTGSEEPDRAIDRLCIVDGHRLAVIRRGYSDGRYTLVDICGRVIAEDAAVRAATPIEWARPG